MGRKLALVMLLGCGLTGCAEKSADMAEIMQKPEPAAEMAKLHPMLGTWEGTAEMIEPTPQEMAAEMPEGEEPMPSSFAGGNTSEMVLDGMFMKSDGWFEMGEGETMHWVEFVTWDEKAKKFHSWWFSSRGETGEGWMTASADGKTFNVNAKGKDAMGRPSSGSGSWEMTSDNTVEWTWAENGPMGKMKMKGTSARKAG